MCLAWSIKNVYNFNTVLFFYKQLKNKQLGPVFAKKLSNFLSNFWPDFQPEIFTETFTKQPRAEFRIKVANYKQLRPDFDSILLSNCYKQLFRPILAKFWKKIRNQAWFPPIS